jgi:hypothetical protein
MILELDFWFPYPLSGDRGSALTGLASRGLEKNNQEIYYNTQDQGIIPMFSETTV